MDPEVQTWLQTAHAATLATILDDMRARGAPFASAVPYALFDDDGEDKPVILISDLAVHTKNLRINPRASLLVGDPAHADDPWGGWRVTLVGTMRMGNARAHEAFRKRHPAAPQLPGFAPWILDVDATRVVAGFGRMGWT
jgi:putative heme iron utilization protein